MKHLLLSASALLLGAFSISADSTVDIVIKDMIANTERNGITLNPNQNYLNFNNWEYLGFKFDVDLENATVKPMYNKAGDYRVHAGSVMTVTAPEDSEMSRIVFSISTDGLRRWPTLTPNSGTVENNTASREIVWTGTANSVAFTIGQTADYGTQEGEAGILQFDKVKISVAGDLGFSSSPTISPEGGKYADSVTITITAAEDAEIYYTTDGTTPDETSTKYTEPFDITNSCTLKAIAIEAGKSASNVVEQSYTIMHGIDILTLRSFLDDNSNWDSINPTDLYTFKGEYTVTYQNGRMLYIEDETAGLAIGGLLNVKYEPGDVITGFRGTFRGVNGIPQLVPVTESFGEPTKHSEYVYEEGTYDKVTNRDNINRAYLLKSVYYTNNTETETKGLYGFVDFSNTDRCTVYNGFSSPSEFNPTVKLPEDGWYDVYGIVTGYTNEGTLEMWFAPTQFEETNGVETIKSSNVINREYFDLSGRRLNGEYRGVTIVREHLNDGTVRTIKAVR